MSEYEYGEAPAPAQMATETWVKQNISTINEYIEMRVRGYQSIRTMRKIFGEEYYDSKIGSRVNHLESTEYFKAKFDERLREISMDKLWNDKLAVHKMLLIVNDDLEKGSTRLKAIQELNILIGITIVDENGKTRKGSSMADFYATQQPANNAQQAPTEPAAITSAK